MVDKYKKSESSKNAPDLDVIRQRQYYGGVIVEDPGYRLRKERLKYIMRQELKEEIASKAKRKIKRTFITIAIRTFPFWGPPVLFFGGIVFFMMIIATLISHFVGGG